MYLKNIKMPFSIPIRAIRNLLIVVLLAIAGGVSAFDPVNDDTDIFLGNPNITAEQPNVLVVMDNTASWATNYALLATSMSSVITELEPNAFRIGLMMYGQNDPGPPKNSANEDTDGGQVRFAVRLMSQNPESSDPTANVRTEMLNLINAWAPGPYPADKGNAARTGLAMLEAYHYYAGKVSIATWARSKGDKVGTTDTWLNTPVLNAIQSIRGFKRALQSGAETALYNTPIINNCQKNYIIYIGSDAPSDNNNDSVSVDSRMASVPGWNGTPVPLANTQFQSSRADELTRFMAGNDVLPDVAGIGNEHTQGKQTVITYAVEINPKSTPSGQAASDLYRSMAVSGLGDYVAVDLNSGTGQLTTELKNIFAKIKSVNTVFASSSLPVSVNVRGTNLNQVYIGVFRPDAQASPRWFGNLKMYKLARETITLPDNTTRQRVILAGADNVEATDPATGFIKRDATSVWTVDSSPPFWDYRAEKDDWFSGGKDLQDGDIVEKGGVGQQLRLAYPSTFNPALEAFPARNLYTCTGASCSIGNNLSLMPFAESNTAITEASLSLANRAVQPLTAYNTQNVTTISDRRDAVLSNPVAGTSKPVTGMRSTGATTLTVTSLTAAAPKSAAITAANGTATILNIDKVSGKFVVTATAALPAGFSAAGATVRITGNANATFNADWPITNQTATTFEINPPGNPATPALGGTATVITTTAVATVAAHGYSNGQSIIIAGANEALFNGTKTISGVTANTFQYTLATKQGAATGTITATASGLIATAVTSTPHGLVAGNPVSIYGATPTTYNGTFTVQTSDGANTFTYNLPLAATNNTGSPVFAVRGGTTTVTVNSPAHGFSTGNQVNISGSSTIGHNGTWTITKIDNDNFSFNTATDAVAPTAAVTQVLPESLGAGMVASVGTGSTISVALNGHGFSPGENIRIDAKSIAPGPDVNHPGSFVVATVSANSFTYTHPAATPPPAPVGQFTARSLDNPKAFVKLAAPHVPALASNNVVTIDNANPTGYNGDYTITLMPAGSGYDYSYPLSPSPGFNVSTAVTSALKTVTARATSATHGFVTSTVGDTTTYVTISGATIAAFNGSFPITVVNADTFTYTLASAEGLAAGAIFATGAGSNAAARIDLIRWMRGQDTRNENNNGSTTDVRASIHGDVLHSRPAVINYNRFEVSPGVASNDDVYVFYGSNDGVFRAIKGGFTTLGGGPAPGTEVWGFVPSEHFGSLNRLRTAAPTISSNFKRPYFADGSIGIYAKDVNNDRKIVAADGDKANIYVSMRRGGRFIYALDVADPVTPKFLWKIDNTSAGFGELGQTWSLPQVIEGFAGLPVPVLIFAGGYDPAVEDIPPDQIVDGATGANATSVTKFGSAATPRTMGRAIYVVNALTGTLIWRGVSPNRTELTPLPGTATSTDVTGMDYAIPSDVTVIRNLATGVINRAYVGDTGGNVWRLDFRRTTPGSATDFGLAPTVVTHLAKLGDVTVAADRRKIFFPPDVARSADGSYDAVVISTGDREHPFEGVIPASPVPPNTTVVKNRIFMLKDRGDDTGPLTGTTGVSGAEPGKSIVHTGVVATDALVDLTADCIERALNCQGSDTPATTSTALGAAKGWYINLEPSEKGINAPLIVGGIAFFGTNLPPGAAGAECRVLGPARLYRVHVADATPIADLNTDGALTLGDRFVEVGQGLLPSSQYAVDEGGLDTVITGPITTEPPTIPLQTRLRKYWYKRDRLMRIL